MQKDQNDHCYDESANADDNFKYKCRQKPQFIVVFCCCFRLLFVVFACDGNAQQVANKILRLNETAATHVHTLTQSTS